MASLLVAGVTGVCSTSHLELVTSLGASAVIDYTTTDLADASAQYDVILDVVGKRKSAAALRG